MQSQSQSSTIQETWISLKVVYRNTTPYDLSRGRSGGASRGEAVTSVRPSTCTPLHLPTRLYLGIGRRGGAKIDVDVQSTGDEEQRRQSTWPVRQPQEKTGSWQQVAGVRNIVTETGNQPYRVRLPRASTCTTGRR